MKQEAVKSKKNTKQKLILLAFYGLFLLMSYISDFEPGLQIADNFWLFSVEMFLLFPPAYILVGLFMVWVDRKTVENYFGKASGYKGYLAALLLASTTLYPFIIVLPMAAALMKKGGRLSIVLTYLSASAICRIPMSIFEATYLGIRFTIIRYLVSLPLIVLTSIFLEKVVGRDYYDRTGLNESFEAP